MNRFSLSSKNMLPETVEVDGSIFAIRTDFRTILRCFRLLDDPEILEEHKQAILLKMFFKGDCPSGGVGIFLDFVRCGEPEKAGSDEKDFDFEQDAKEIYSGFMQLYGIDLAESNMHWYKFVALLGGVFAAGAALSNKIEIRHSKDSESKRRANADRARQNAAIQETISAEEERIQQEIIRRLNAGESLKGVV